MPYLELQDCRLFYTVDDHTDPWTHPDTVLFVHGFTEHSEAWRAWVPHFSRRYRVLRIDQRGFGRSCAVAKEYPLTTERYVDDLAQVIRQVVGGPAHLVAGKSGGISVMTLAAVHPELVILPLDGYHAAATDPDLTAGITREFIDKHSHGKEAGRAVS
jgi:pimeloyl-ACP methyl ester carboxylesterase